MRYKRKNQKKKNITITVIISTVITTVICFLLWFNVLYIGKNETVGQLQEMDKIEIFSDANNSAIPAISENEYRQEDDEMTEETEVNTESYSDNQQEYKRESKQPLDSAYEVMEIEQLMDKIADLTK